MGAHAYATTNLLSGLAAAAYTWSNGYAGSDRALVNDGRMDKRVVIGSPALPFNVVIDLGSAQSVAGVAILNHNLKTVGLVDVNVTITGADNAAMTVNPVTAKASSEFASYLSTNSREPTNKDHVFQFAAVSKRYWRLAFAEGGGPTTITNAAFGEFFFYAASTALTRKGIYGSGDGVKLYTSELQFDNGESRGVFFGGPVRRKVLRWQDYSTTERDELRKLFYATTGNANRLLFIDSRETSAAAAAAAEQDCIYGRLEGLDDMPFPEMDFSRYQLPDLQVRSLGREVGA